MKNAISKFFAWLGKGLSEDNGNPSTIRIVVFYASLLWVTAIFIGILVTVFYYRELWLAVLGMILGGLFSLLGVKAYQKGKEQDINGEPKQ